MEGEKSFNKLKWMNEPLTWNVSESTGLTIVSNEKQDFWRKTYYKPCHIANDGHLMHDIFSSDENIMAETYFELTAVNQFDQAGLMVYFDEEHWIKTGIEYADGTKRLSCVVTNDFSDWSTQNFDSNKLFLRLYKIGYDFVVEAKSVTDAPWSFIRICRLHNPTNVPQVKMGLYACSPTAKGGSVNFKYVAFKNVDKYHHKF